MINRQIVAQLWQARAQLSRQQILGSFDKDLMPVVEQPNARTAIPGSVGRNYQERGLVIVSVNPAGGRDSYIGSDHDNAIYGAARALAECTASDLVPVFERLNSAMEAAMPGWGPQWRVIRELLDAVGSDLDTLAYVYLVPFRTRHDEGSRLPRPVLAAGASNGFADIIRVLRPGHVIAVDRPSEAAVNDLAGVGGFKCTYYTRKRDAHAERAKIRDELRANR